MLRGAFSVLKKRKKKSISMHNAHAKRLVCMSVDIYIYIWVQNWFDLFIYCKTKTVKPIFFLNGGPKLIGSLRKPDEASFLV